MSDMTIRFFFAFFPGFGLLILISAPASVNTRCASQSKNRDALMDPRWSDADLSLLKNIKGFNFEVVRMDRIVTK